MSDDNDQENETDIKKTDQEVSQANTEGDQAEQDKPKKKVIPGKKGVKNQHGDYVVTSIDIPDHRSGIKKDKQKGEQDSDSSSDEGYGDEDDTQEQPKPQEEVKEGKSNLQCLTFNLIEPKPQTKKLSKKEQKKLEDEEFEKMMADMGVKSESNNTTEQPKNTPQ